MSSADRMLFALNCSLALLAIPASLWGIALASKPVRILRLTVAALAGVYVGGYLWVLEVQDPVRWSHLFRRVSPLAFALVWIAGPVMATMERRRMVRHASRAMESDNAD